MLSLSSLLPPGQSRRLHAVLLQAGFHQSKLDSLCRPDLFGVFQIPAQVTDSFLLSDPCSRANVYSANTCASWQKMQELQNSPSSMLLSASPFLHTMLVLAEGRRVCRAAKRFVCASSQGLAGDIYFPVCLEQRKPMRLSPGVALTGMLLGAK